MSVWEARLTANRRFTRKSVLKVFRRLQFNQIVQIGQREFKMAHEDGPVTFNSRSKSPNNKFSNFYEVEIKMPEGVFGSVEHYFQAMKFTDGNHSRFEVSGDLGKRKIESGTWNECVSRGRFIKSAGGKSGTQKYTLTLRSDGLVRERARQKMKEGKFRKLKAFYFIFYLFCELPHNFLFFIHGCYKLRVIEYIPRIRTGLFFS